MEQGQVMEEGTHEELMARGGRYRELFEMQSRYYREREEQRRRNAFMEENARHGRGKGEGYEQTGMGLSLVFA